MVLNPEREEMAKAIFKKWELDFATIGHLTDTGRMVLKFKGETVCDIPVAPLSEEAPVYDRPYVETPKREILAAESVAAPRDIGQALASLLAHPNIASKAWIWQQYDHMVMNDTVLRPGADAAIVRVHGTDKGLAIATDCTPRYVEADPYEGGKQAVAETWRNLCAVGAEPLAITDCLNFGNPQKPEVMGQIVGAITGMAEACRALDYPVVSGNVSLYNDTHGASIQPTPAIGGLGLIRNLARRGNGAFTAVGHTILLVGDTRGHLGSSLYLREILGSEEGAPPVVDLAVEKRNGIAVRDIVRDGLTSACHDLADGGLLVALAEMCFPHNIGAQVRFPSHIPAHAFAFGEDQSRYLLSVPHAQKDLVLFRLNGLDVPVFELGETIADDLVVEDFCRAPVAHLRDINALWLPGYMAA